MKPLEQFAFTLRIIAVLGIIYLAHAFVRNPSPPNLVLIGRIVSVVIGAYFLRGAPLLVRFAYPESTPGITDTPSA